ncbi:MAG: hypothetical protein H0U98_09515 [Alphaproteobacteria bacterium]|nr:hypothetical protein [Alphaproteobacteria bacterium]
MDATGARLDGPLTESAAASREVAAAKLHVLHLDPIKAKLGAKWDKLSTLVHTLFEKSLRRAQGPADHFLLVDEMSYVVTFHELSLEEASVACASVAQEVCDMLFGADVDDISIRGLIGPVPAALLESATASGAQITELLERIGGEILVTPHQNPKIIWEKASVPATAVSAGAWNDRALLLAEQAGVKAGYFPVWELAARKSSTLFLSAFNRTSESPISSRSALRGMEMPRIVNFETTLLAAAAEYAQGVHAAQKHCALCVSVSYETLSGFHSRIAYIGALKSIQVPADCPLLLCIDQVPDGTPVGRLAEIVAMLAMPNVRIMVQFESLRALPELGIRLGAIGIGGVMPYNCDTATAGTIAQKLVRRATEQKGFAFLHGLDNDAALDTALNSHVRFGSGRAIQAGRIFSGKDPIPDFPLRA